MPRKKATKELIRDHQTYNITTNGIGFELTIKGDRVDLLISGSEREILKSASVDEVQDFIDALTETKKILNTS